MKSSSIHFCQRMRFPKTLSLRTPLTSPNPNKHPPPLASVAMHPLSTPLPSSFPSPSLHPTSQSSLLDLSLLPFSSPKATDDPPYHSQAPLLLAFASLTSPVIHSIASALPDSVTVT